MVEEMGVQQASVAEGSTQEGQDTGVISFPVLLIITINSIMGTGVFFLPAVGTAKSGPASIIAWVIMSVYAISMAGVFGELAGMFSFGGGVYEYSKKAFSTFPSFIIGWITMLSSYVTIAMLVVGAIMYLLPLGGLEEINMFGLSLPPEAMIVGISLFFIIAFNYVAYMGMETGAIMLVTFGLITMTTVTALIVPSWFEGFNTASFQPFMPAGAGSVFLTLFFIAETFFGWESVCLFTPQVKNGRRNVPKALLIGTGIIIVFALVFVVSSINIAGGQITATDAPVEGTLGSFQTPISDLGRMHYGAFGYDLFTILCYVAIIGSVAGWIVSSPGLIQTLAEDKLFPKQLAELHHKKKTPYKAIIFQTIVISILVFVAAGSYEELLHLLLPLVLALYSFTVIAFIKMRYTKKEQDRAFKLPFGVPIGVGIILFHMFVLGIWVIKDHSAMQTVLFGTSLIVLGIPLYFLLTMYYNPEAIRKVQEATASFSLLTESVFIPSKVRKEVFDLIGDIQDKNVLEYGCGVGTFSKQIAQHVSRQKRVYVTSMSKKELVLTHKRLAKKQLHEHVIFIHDDHHVNRIHPDVGVVDAVVSFGMLSYMQNVEQILSDLRNTTSPGARICFVDYIDFFKVLPNNDWLAKIDVLEDKFKEYGFSVEVKKIKGMLWNYLFIYGFKAEGFSKDQVQVASKKEDISDVPYI
jgi:APA family basic amino acid/polyamine antiporter